MRLPLVLLGAAASLLSSQLCEGRRAVSHDARRSAEDDGPSSSSKKSTGSAGKLALEQVLAGKDASTTEDIAVFSGETLAYVTPWNGAGYDFAKRFRAKLDWVSPVWYQLRTPTGGGVELTGTHNVDEDWLAAVRYGEKKEKEGGGKGGMPKTCAAEVGGSAGACSDDNDSAGDDDSNDDDKGLADDNRRGSASGKRPLIVPRFVLEATRGLTGRDIPNMAEMLVAEAARVRYDGYVAEIQQPMGQLAVEFFKAIKNVSGGQALKLILVVPPMQTEAGQFEHLEPYVDRYSFMTYDYPLAKKGVPNAPLPWMRIIMEHQVQAHAEGTRDARKKNPALKAKRGGGSQLLMGVPFYGYDNGEAVVAGSFMDRLSTAADVGVKWDAEHREHIFTYSPGHTVTFPTPPFVRERVQLAQEIGVGLAIWEIGQGMTYLFDEL